MARNESDREDLYEELRLAVPRWEFLPAGVSVPVVAGIRDDGRLLVYLTPDRTFQFDSNNRLLRAFENGTLYRTQGNTLARLQRNRTESTSGFIRHDLDADELRHFLEAVQQSLQKLLKDLESPGSKFLRSTETDPITGHQLKERLFGCAVNLPLLAPAYRTKRK